MVQAYLMISTATGTAEGLAETIGTLDTVSEAHVVAGKWDVITEMEAETVRDVLRSVTSEVRSLDGVGTTRCYFCLD